MAITLNDNIKINAGKPIDTRYLSSGNTSYVTKSAVFSAIPISERYIGLTVLVSSGASNVELWFKTGVTDTDLVEKKFNSVLPIDDYVTGGTNIGYFSGRTGVQSLNITTIAPLSTDYWGTYNSLYNYYYRGADGIIHIGTPSDGILKRGYVKTAGLDKSWIWNEYTGGTNMVGWILIDGNVSNFIGTFQYGVTYYNTPSQVHTSVTPIIGTKGNLIINSIVGSLATGNTLTIGARPYAFKDHNNLHFRTMISDTPSTINVWDDNDAIIHLSAATTSVSAKNVGAKVPIYSGTSGTTFIFKTLVGGGSTAVTDHGNYVMITSSGGSGGGGYYDLSSPAAISVGGIASGTTLTGKTAFELFEQLLVPTLNPTLINPSVGISIVPSGVFEIGCVVPTITVTGCFNAGCIAPQYGATCDKRSCGAQAYCFTGCQINSCIPDINSSRSAGVVNYVICDGIQTWGVKAHYQAGVQPYDSKGSTYSTPLLAGATSTVNASLTGILPWYWGMSNSMAVDSVCVANCGCGGSGCKCLTNVDAAPVSITFNSTSDDYIWFAFPSCASLKTCWCINAANSGSIGGIGNLFAVCPTPIAVTSVEGCWINQNYDVYVSCYKTGTASGIPMYIS